MTMLTPPEIDRIAKIAALIESSNDGEALAAARMLGRQLGRHSLRLADVIRAGLTLQKAAETHHIWAYRAPPSPPDIQHKLVIDEMLSDMAFVGEHLTCRAHDRLMTLWYARELDDVNAAYVENWHAKFRAGKVAA